MKFSVFGKVTGSKYLGIFEATTAEEAVEMALQSKENTFNICHQCSDEFELDDMSCSEGTAEEATNE